MFVEGVLRAVPQTVDNNNNDDDESERADKNKRLRETDVVVLNDKLVGEGMCAAVYTHLRTPCNQRCMNGCKFCDVHDAMHKVIYNPVLCSGINKTNKDPCAQSSIPGLSKCEIPPLCTRHYKEFVNGETDSGVVATLKKLRDKLQRNERERNAEFTRLLQLERQRSLGFRRIDYANLDVDLPDESYMPRKKKPAMQL